MVLFVVLLFIIFTLNNCAHANFFASIHDMDSLKITYESVMNNLGEYLDAEAKRLEKLQKIFDMFRGEHVHMENMKQYAGNPMNFFRVIKRLTADLEHIEHLTNNSSSVFKKDPDLKYPTSADLHGTVEGLNRVQVVYQIKTSDLANGVLIGNFSEGRELFTEQTTPAMASDCYIIGKILHEIRDYNRSIEWLLEALSRFDNSNEPIAFDKINTMGYLRNNYHELCDFIKAKQLTEELHSMSDVLKNREDEINSIDYYTAQLADETFVLFLKNFAENYHSTRAEYILENYHPHLCRGEGSIPEDIKKELSCFYMQGPHPILKIAPIKTELVYNDPEIFLFHQILSDDEIDYISLHSAPTLLRAGVADPHSGEYSIVSYRTAKNTWLSDDDHEVVAKLSRRVSDFSGSLDLSTSENLLVANYGIGGHYEAHFDFNRNTYFEMLKARNETDEIGHRIATVLIYMSDVEQGGATSFVDLGITVYPEKGAALLWWDLHPSGEPDFRTRHAACPVLRGNKWISNKWLHQKGQELIKPCNLEFQSTEHLPFSIY